MTEKSRKQIISAILVIVAIGVVAYVFEILHGTTISDTKEMRAQQELLLIKTALLKYKGDHKNFPTDEEGLKVLVDPTPNGKYFVNDHILRDPWGHLVVYHRTNQGEGFIIYSLGPSGIDKAGQGDNINVQLNGTAK